MSITRIALASIAWLLPVIFVGTSTSVLAVPMLCLPPSHQQCDRYGNNCHCVIGATSGAAKSSGTAKTSSGATHSVAKHPVGGTSTQH
jgi:hypothetical protein